MRPAAVLTPPRETRAPEAPARPTPAVPTPAVRRAVPTLAVPTPAVATLERPTPATQSRKRPGIAARVRALPRVLLDTVAWGGFAAVVALIVIALSDVGAGRAALWAMGLTGIVVLAVAVMALAGTRLDDLDSVSGSADRPE